MIAIDIKDVQTIIRSFNQELNECTANVKLKLEAYKKQVRGRQKRYIDHLISKLPDIITDVPHQLSTYCGEFNTIMTQKEIGSKKQKIFREKIIEILGYQEQRSKFYPKYFQKIGIKSCVYCNALLTVTVDRDDKKTPRRAKFQVDHYLPKSKYPFLSASLFNLYPVCANCNNIKREESVFFKLYQDSPSERSDFSFKLNSGVSGAFLLDRNYESIEFTFEPPPTPKDYINPDQLFDITGVYQTQKDVIEEMILKAESYSKGYRETLKASLPEIFKDDLLIERLVVGNYTKDKDLHKRPLAKFSRDMAIAVGLLKEEDTH